MQHDLFPATLGPGTQILRGLASDALLADIAEVVRAAPLRRFVTPFGKRMSVAMTNCGEWGWVSDERGYRYVRDDPQSGAPWPAMPARFLQLAAQAAPGFVPDACLVNRYTAGTKLTRHQDKNERDFSQPIVSVSFGASATFVMENGQRYKVELGHGDVVVFGGPARLAYHQILPMKGDRWNLTLRRAME